MVKREPAWVKKWRELERLVDKKYAAYISIVGLSIDQFNEAAIRNFRVYLTIRKYSFFIGGGRPRAVAIANAIKAIRNNRELQGYVCAYEQMPLPVSERAIVVDCAFPGVKPPRRRLPAVSSRPLTAEERRMLDKVLPR